MSTTNSMSLILTQSQEQLLTDINGEDVDVETMMNLLQGPIHQQETRHYESVLHEHKLFSAQLEIGEELNNLQNDFISYTTIPQSLPLMPVAPSVISNEEYAGPLNFEVFIDPNYGTKNPWVYSVVLNKLYITMLTAFPVDFKCDFDEPNKNYYVRATPLYSLAQHAQELISRCASHAQYDDNSNKNIPHSILDHVLRCQDYNAEYYGNKDNKVHLSVRVPLGTPQTGMDVVRLMYTFVCKNSCPSGMNRKPLEVIFTLEDECGLVLGRRKLNARVCSCPKRDKDKEENDHLKDDSKRNVSAGKRRKMDKKIMPSTPLDTEEYSFMVTVCGKHNKRIIQKNAFDLMAGEIARHGSTPAFEKCLEKCRTDHLSS